MQLRRLLILLPILLIAPVLTAQASTLPGGFSESLIVPLDSLSRPTGFTIVPDGRLFITLQGDSNVGKVMVYDGVSILPDPLITVDTNSSEEHGLLGLTLDPNFDTNGYIYLYYTTDDGPDSVNRVSRFTVTGNTADPASEVVLIETDRIGTAPWHHGGGMKFGPDGKLYIAIGDDLNDPGPPVGLPHVSQRLDSLFGKILRINADGTIPTDNPFYAAASGKYRAIWAMGLRHPYKLSFRANDPSDDMLMFTEVGNNRWEEVNVGSAGANYGWPQTEGDFNQEIYPGFTKPVYFYHHGPDSDEEGCAATAGAFYNPPTPSFPAAYVGKFFFADFCNGWMKTIDPDTDTVENFALDTDPNVIDIEFSPIDGSMYYLVRTENEQIDAGHLYHVTYTGPHVPEFTVQPQDQTASLTQTATFSCSAFGNPAPTYQWQRDGSDIGGATDDVYTTPPLTLADDGAQFRCVATNTLDTTYSNAATLTILDNQPPTPTILAPLTTMPPYTAGQKIAFKGTATDPEDGVLSASRFTWSVMFQHADHAHPFMPPKSGIKSGTFIISTSAHTDINVWYRVFLTVTDSSGASTTTYTDIHPNVARITVQTNPLGLTFDLDGIPHSATTIWDEVAGIHHTLGAPTRQTLGGTIYVPSVWSDGKRGFHTIKAPAVDTTYTANFKLIDVLNGSFEEANTAGIPLRWSASGIAAPSGQMCGVSDDGSCSFTLIGGSTIKRLKQGTKLTGYAGDDLSVNFAAQAAGASGFTVRVILHQKDGGSQIQDFILDGSYGWTPQTINLIASEPYKSVEVQIIGNMGAVGQVWIDGVHLALNN